MPRARILIFGTLLGIALFFSFLNISGLKRSQEKLLLILSPLIHSQAALKKKFEKVVQQRMTLEQLEEANNALVLENQKLQAENEVLHSAADDNTKLRAALGYRTESPFKLVPATIIARDNSTWWNTVKIDRGSNDGIASDMPVITENGLVGKTSVVTPTLSVVVLLTDENCNVASKVEGTADQGITCGLRVPTGELQLQFLNKLANLQPGQKVYSAGVSGGIFPSGLKIGVVKSFHVRELDGQAILEPAADLSALDHVFVIAGAR